ncbi:hypothetical protein CC2G_012922 [Coprinopsis cinerea AmutBmut pab1-1]|nr:hypothetical protein CC2G_012922 [Coprinopsis cinerea AmutBmut pab1-1]
MKAYPNSSLIPSFGFLTTRSKPEFPSALLAHLVKTIPAPLEKHILSFDARSGHDVDMSYHRLYGGFAKWLHDLLIFPAMPSASEQMLGILPGPFLRGDRF